MIGGRISGRRGARLALALCLWCAVSGALSAQAPFRRGVNLSGWFQAQSARQLHATRFGPEDFRGIRSLGCDVVRLPVNLHAMTGGAPDYRIDPLLFRLLDQAIDQALDAGLKLIIDNHSIEPGLKMDPLLATKLPLVWSQLADRYRDRPMDVYYEVFNEPHDIPDAEWGRIQGQAIAAIRAVDTRHTIIVGGAGWNSLRSLDALPRYADPKLLYTFHFYDPMVFTHQGADWAGLKDLAGVPFPPRGKSPPGLPDSLKSGWVPGEMRRYWTSDAVAELGRSLDIAAAFARTRQVTVYCGEFGVYNAKADPSERVAWYRTVRGMLEARGIPWTTWDYQGTFGLFAKDSPERFAHDLNLPLLEALGLEAVAQTPGTVPAPELGFWMYRDQFARAWTADAWLTRGSADFYCQEQPHGGEYCIKLSGLKRYEALRLEVRPAIDLSRLSRSASQVFRVRADRPGDRFDVRFVDRNAGGAGGLPWRMSATIDGRLAAGDGQWHAVSIPLAAMKETGAWDGQWHEPEAGAFAWDRVARLEIVAEQADLAGGLWLDDIGLQ